MALYFNVRVQGEGRPVADTLAWHQKEPIAACGWAANKASVLGEDGDRVHVTSRSTTCSCIQWHPEERIVVFGWKDGFLTTWSEEFGETQEPAGVHDSTAVTAMQWSHFGHRLLTASRSCSVGMWRMDFETGKLSPMWTAKSDIPVSIITYMHSTRSEAPGSDGGLIVSEGEGSGQIGSDCVFALAGPSGTVYGLDESKTTSALVNLDKDAAVVSMLWNADKRYLVTMSNNNTIAMFHVGFDMRVQQLLKRKISTGPGADMSCIQMIEILPGLVATSCGERMIRVFNIVHDSMYVLTFPEVENAQGGSSHKQAHIVSLAGNASKGVLAAATKEGQLALWTFVGANSVNSDEEEDWQSLTAVDLEANLDCVQIGPQGSVMAATPDSVMLMLEAIRKRKWTGAASAVQCSPDTVEIEYRAPGAPEDSASIYTIKSGSRIKSLDLAMPYVSIWSGKSVEIYSINSNSSQPSLLHSMEHANPVVAVHPDGIFVGRGERVEMMSYQLHKTNTINFPESEGTPSDMDVNGDFAVIITKLNMMRLYRVSSRELRLIGTSRQVFKGIMEDLQVVSVRVNAKGKRVALITRKGSSGQIDSRLWVYDVDTDKISSYNFAASHQYPVAVHWHTPAGGVSNVSGSEAEFMMLAVETRHTKDTSKDKKTDNNARSGSVGGSDANMHASGESHAPAADGVDDAVETSSGSRVYTMFANADIGVVPHHSFPFDRNHVCLAGMTIPHLCMITMKGSGIAPHDHRIEFRRLRDFDGMETDGDQKLRDALMQFSFHATVNNMDEAYRAIKTIKDPSVWSNLAKLCVKTRRLDVAEVCLGNMQDAVAARALRESQKEPEIEARLAILAINLGLVEDAERLLKKCKRADLLTQLYIACGRWDQAVKNADDSDRIHIRAVNYRYAQHLEQEGNANDAMQYYETAHCAATEIPRLLVNQGRTEELQRYAQSSNDSQMLGWWAQYQESNGDLYGAQQTYMAANDVLNSVRLLCCQDPPEIERAIELVTRPENEGKQGGAYYIARQYEDQGNVQKAIFFYTMASAFKHGIRIAKENEMLGEIVNLALKSGDRHVAMDCGQFFEERGMFEKAVQLYRKGGDEQRAIDTCIKGGLFDALQEISESMDAMADPAAFLSMAEHFIAHHKYDQAASMLIFAKAYNEAVQLCVDKGVKLTDEMAEAMTLPKTENPEDEDYRLALLRKIAKVAKMQESWHLACKKYTQAGDKIKAMKMLLRSGDTEKIIFFANHSRNAEIYVLAGNYLQTLKWQEDQNVYKSILQFYTKAKAWESLAGFHDACAQIQIDDFRDYDKALSTLREAQKILDKGDALQSKKDLLRQRVSFVETFVHARQMIKPGEACPDMVAMCSELIDRSQPDHPERELLESALRIGDVFALMVEYYEKLAQYENAFALMERMVQNGIELNYFLEANLVQKVCNAAGRELPVVQQQQSLAYQQSASAAHYGGDAEEFVEEDVLE